LLALNSEVVECKACPRLVGYRESIARVKKAQFASWSYWGRPVPGFGDIQARVLVIGLAPAPHGGNRTGRLFTGDKSADFLIRALFQAGFANQPGSVDREDGLVLKDAYITAAVKCVPPDNRPTNQEISNCSRFLERELEICNKSRVILCLGQVAFRSTMNVLKELGLFSSRIPDFEHGLRVELADGRKVYGSYHPSPRNTQTGKLTAAMFNALLRRISESLSRPS
jgi:uracil-DNA glycosylase family 4